MLRDFLPKENILVIDKLDDWQLAVKIGSLPLLEKGNISFSYINNMIKSVDDIGPYMVIDEYFALMHAKPGDGVLKQGISLLIVKEPVDLAGKPVKIFLILAAEDAEKHLNILQQIVELLMNRDNYNILLSANKDQINTLLD